jgi:hypothetical protein
MIPSSFLVCRNVAHPGSLNVGMEAVKALCVTSPYALGTVLFRGDQGHQELASSCSGGRTMACGPSPPAG